MAVRRTLVSALVAYVARLRFPALAAIAALLFGLDLLVPDVVPFADEVLLGLLTAVFASWRRERRDGEPEAPESEAPAS